jgi:four helix bundle protein
MYDLEERTFQFAKDVAVFIKKIPKTTGNIEYSKQVIRSSGSVGANYIEANESLSKKDFNMRIKICRKEAKETCYWLRLLVETNDKDHSTTGDRLIGESDELKKIFSSIIEKSK